VTGVQEVVDEQESSSSRCIEGSPASESVVRVATDDGLEDTIDTFERETPD